MDIITILDAFKQYGLLALAAAAAFSALLGAAWLIYKRLLHGTKPFSKGQWVTAILLLGWFTVVLGLTTLSRGANYTGEINPALFSGYKNAWNEWSLKEYQLIIFNMLMFSPLGFLLPFLTKKGEKFSVACLVSFFVTLSVEVLQLVTGRGIFELDDLLHNLVGSMFGYFVSAFILETARNRKVKRKPLLRMTAVPLFFAALTIAAVLVYRAQPYGNLPFLPAEKQDMSIVTVKNQVQLSDEARSVPIFKNAYTNDNTRIREISESFSGFAGVTFRRMVRTDGFNKIFQSSAGDEQLTAFLKNGNWSYTNWKEAVVLSEEQASEYRKAVERWLSENGSLPETAVFSLQDKSILRWDIEMPPMEEQTSDFTAGTIMVRIDADGNYASFDYYAAKYEYVGTLACISAAEAYNQILDGNFEQYNSFERGDILVVTGCSMDYEPDTKGFSRPVYRFEGYINTDETPWEGVVSAE